jgi:anti-anti-sigma factor
VLLAAGLSEALVIAIGLLEIFAPSLAGFTPNPTRAITSTIIIFTLIIGVLSLFLDRFGSSLREALTTALAREQELERLRASLETTVAERTASLQQALQDVEQREAQLTKTLEDLGASQEAVRELSAPVLPVLPGVIVAPLIGAIDSDRAAALAENVLGMVERLRARHVIFDITGVPVVDTHVAGLLLQTATAVRLLGAQVLLVGIRPEVAQTIVTLGIDLGTIAAYPRLQEAVVALMELRNGQRTGNAGRIADAS